MQQTIIKGYQVMIFTGYHGTQLFITHPEGYTIYAHKRDIPKNENGTPKA